MAQNSILDDNARKVLQAITDSGVVRGALVMRRAGLTDPQELSASVRLLVKLDLINASGDITDPKQIYMAVFSPRPSKSGLIRNTLKQAL